MTDAKPTPSPRELFVASLTATALVYGVGILVIAALVMATSASKGAGEAVRDGIVFLGFFATVGVGFATLAAVVLVAPLGTAFGTLMLRATAPRWWQGPITGLLVALAVVAMSVTALALSGELIDMGTYAVASIPVLLAPFAGAFVQYRMLRWAAPERFA